MINKSKRKKVNKNGLSIITVVLNGEKYIEETIDSVLSQKNINLEYIIIDGGSNDKTLDKISKYGNKIDLLISEPDGGIYYAKNKGIKLASKDLIGEINCGDSYEPGVLSLVYDEFCKTSADIIYGDIKIIEQFRQYATTYCLKANHNQLKNKMSIFHPATFVRRECYIQNGFYNINYKLAADYDFLLKLFQINASFKYVPKVLANFRKGGISSSNFRLSLKENFQIRQRRLNIYHALKYIIYVLMAHFYFAGRKWVIEKIIGENNYARIKHWHYKSNVQNL